MHWLSAPGYVLQMAWFSGLTDAIPFKHFDVEIKEQFNGV